MDYRKQMQDDLQFVQGQMRPEAFDTMHQRHSANYKPTIWKYDFLQSLTNEYDEEIYKGRAEKLKENVMCMFDEAEGQFTKLQLIDKIKKFGLANLFKEEIEEALNSIASNNNKKACNVEEDLHATALCFRLLRQHGHKVSQDMFKGYLNEMGTFSKSICTNIKGMLELFEASHLALEGENILDEAKAFSAENLKEISSDLDSNIAKQVAHALELPLHWRVKWFDVKWHINVYEKEEHKNSILLELAKLNFNMVQATHQEELKEISRWWRNLGLIENLSFTRDRLVESFLWTVGLTFEPRSRCFRKWLTKVINLILIIDDVYDIYGSFEELESFTKAVDRWDSNEAQQLPDCMKICFQALYDITNEIAHAIQKEQGWGRVLPLLKKVWADFCKALFVEAKWYNKGYTPSLQEYLGNAWITSSGPVLCLHAFLAVTHEVTQEMVDLVEANRDLIYCSSLITRLCNDLGTSTAELERGDAPSSILCHMREANVSEEIARKHIREVIVKTWTKMNDDCFTQSPLLQPVVNIIANVARVAQCIYQFGDGFGVQDRETKEHVLSLLIEPLI
ncbi:hypothetical protein L1049_010496 [Liquidambar formosana]|uniref:Alpha-farnesene synthase n=1 Tax=Liquidambar formosana TaxID=63359 RepID=A0AAP0N9F6_LIQFO